MTILMMQLIVLLIPEECLVVLLNLDMDIEALVVPLQGILELLNPFSDNAILMMQSIILFIMEKGLFVLMYLDMVIKALVIPF